ncbi:MAG: hypothetical protein AAGH19_10180, partial [Pseudomonadota bacterium]
DMQLSDEERAVRNQLAETLYRAFGSGMRYDGTRTLDRRELDELRDRRRIFTGSRIKREDGDALPLVR